MDKLIQALQNLKASLISGGSSSEQAQIDCDLVLKELSNTDNTMKMRMYLLGDSTELKTVVDGLTNLFMTTQLKTNFKNDLS